jgi:tetratricopeptide (TPR) repeat protein
MGLILHKFNFGKMMYKLLLVYCTIALWACTNNPKSLTDKPIDASSQEKEMKEAIAQFPDSVLLKENLIQYYEDNDNIDLALSQTNAVLEKDSNNVRFWNKKGDLYFVNADTLNAIKAYEKSIDLFPDPKIIMSLGALYAQTKNVKSLALADALLIGKNAHAEKEALLIKGLYYSYTGEKQKAISFFDKSLRFDYTFMPAYLEKGIALYDMNKINDALLIFDKAVTVQNGYDEGYYWMGRCFEKLNKTQDAIESYKMALSYDPNYIEAKDALSKLGVRN